MASVLSESSSSTTTTATLPSTLGLSTFQILPPITRLREGSYGFGHDPGQAQIRLNRLVAEAFHGESSSELRNAELGRAATRALVNFSINQERENRRRFGTGRQEMNEDTEMSGMERDEGWESIQDYGNFLRESADSFRVDSLYPSPPVRRNNTPPASISPRKAETQENLSIEGVSWQHFRLRSEFAHLAPLTARENRIQAKQTGKLIDWISDPENDHLFRWDGLAQVSNLQSESEEALRRREMLEIQALEKILEDTDDQSTNMTRGITAELGRGATQGETFAKYLATETPQWSTSRFETGVTSIEPSRSSSMGGSDEDTRSVVSQDNHWRRTIFG
jgi:hypothetical protein